MRALVDVLEEADVVAVEAAADHLRLAARPCGRRRRSPPCSRVNSTGSGPGRPPLGVVGLVPDLEVVDLAVDVPHARSSTKSDHVCELGLGARRLPRVLRVVQGPVGHADQLDLDLEPRGPGRTDGAVERVEVDRPAGVGLHGPERHGGRDDLGAGLLGQPDQLPDVVVAAERLAGSPVADCTLRSILGPGRAAVGVQVSTTAPIGRQARGVSSVVVGGVVAAGGGPDADAGDREHQRRRAEDVRRDLAGLSAVAAATRRGSGHCQCSPPNAWRSQGTPSAISTPIAISQPTHSPRAPPMIPPTVTPATSITNAAPASRVASPNRRWERQSATRWSLNTIHSPAGTNNARIAQE